MTVPEPTGRRHDYRRQMWGHACSVQCTKETFADLPLFRGHAFAVIGVRVGDEIILTMQSGRVGVYRLVEVEACRDPNDMYFIACVPIGYLGEEVG